MSFALLATVQLLVNAHVTVTSIAGPAIARSLALTRTELVLAGAAYGLAFSGLLLLGGRLTDLTDQRRAFALGTGILAVCSAAVAASPTAATLIAARFLAGCGAALAAPSAMALLGSIFPEPPRKTRMIALWGSLAGVGAVVGILAGGVLASLLTWRWLFVVLAVVALGVALAAPRLLPRGAAPAPGRVDATGALLATAGIGAVGYGFTMAGAHGWSALGVLLPMGSGIVLLASFAAAESMITYPLLPLRLLGPATRVTALLTTMIGPASGACTAFVLSLYFQQVRGWSPLTTAAAFLPYGVVLSTVGLLSRRLVERVGARRVAPTGLLVISAGLILISRLAPEGPLGVPLLAGLVVLPIGMGLAVPAAVATAMEGMPAHQTGLAAGVVNTAMLTGPSIGLAVLTSLADSRATALRHTGQLPAAAAVGGYAHAFTLAAALLFAAALMSAAVHLRRR